MENSFDEELLHLDLYVFWPCSTTEKEGVNHGYQHNSRPVETLGLMTCMSRMPSCTLAKPTF